METVGGGGQEAAADDDDDDGGWATSTSAKAMGTGRSGCEGWSLTLKPSGVRAKDG
jgi:hypothetical protein